MPKSERSAHSLQMAPRANACFRAQSVSHAGRRTSLDVCSRAGRTTRIQGHELSPDGHVSTPPTALTPSFPSPSSARFAEARPAPADCWSPLTSTAPSRRRWMPRHARAARGPRRSASPGDATPRGWRSSQRARGGLINVSRPPPVFVLLVSSLRHRAAAR
jgi:hypothetical protein